MQPRIETLPEKKFIGKRIQTSFSRDNTFTLWQNFMPRRKEIESSIGTTLYSIEVYPPRFFDRFDPDSDFEKWAAVEVEDSNEVPAEMDTITSPEGLYAVFIHKGLASAAPATYQYIFGTWLPNSHYILDERPHLAVMGEKYRQEDPGSEEEIWIPVKTM